MKDYNTIEEKASEWNISVRHIQLLCREGKIKGAVKRAGAWFIPDDVSVPAKNTKLNVKEFKFVGTKNKIFNNAIELFKSKGFNNVSFKDIADSVGIRQSTVYNHFKTKQDILDSIYGFYCHYYLHERLSLNDMELIIKKDSLIDIIKCIRYEFKDDYRQMMLDITKIIFQRIGIDERAREIARTLVVDEGIRYVENVFDIAVESGRLAPFDTHIMAVFINIVRIFTLYCQILEPEPSIYNMTGLFEDEQELYKYALKFLVDLKNPDKNN